MKLSTRFKQFKSWIRSKLRKLFKLPVNEPWKRVPFCLSRKTFSRPPPSFFPTDVLVYMKKNANVSQALKLIQVCKYFWYLQYPYFLHMSVNDYFYTYKYPTTIIVLQKAMDELAEREPKALMEWAHMSSTKW
uniref:Uncharacterized protein n=1 Tax=Panagrolaimus superbus TaxID=310955 RepID=A0A914YKI9_9BILA